MSAYRCARCEKIGDSHDGCVECPWNEFECICEDCAYEIEEELRVDAEALAEREAIEANQ